MLARLAEHAFGRLTKQELNLCGKCKLYCTLSREAAEGNDEIEACRCIAIAHAVAASRLLSEEASLLCLAEVAPAEAYIERLSRNWKGAQLNLERSLRLDEHLEVSFGYTGKIGHRAHLLTTAISLAAQQGDSAGAAWQTGQCLRYLAGNTARIDLPGDWGRERRQALTVGLEDFIALQALDAFVSTLAGFQGAARAELIRELVASLGDSGDADGEEQGLASLVVTMWSASVAFPANMSANDLVTRVVSCLERVRGSISFHAIAFDIACLLQEHSLPVEGTSQLARFVLEHVEARPWSLPLRTAWRMRLERLDQRAMDSQSARDCASRSLLAAV